MVDLIKPDISTDKHTGERLVKQAFIKGKAISFPGGDHDIIYIVFFKQSSRSDLAEYSDDDLLYSGRNDRSISDGNELCAFENGKK